MPELPEVETVRRTLSELVLGKTIASVEVRLPRLIKRPDDISLFASMLTGKTIQSVERRGKFLRFIFDDLVLLSHLRMEGRYGLYRRDEAVEPHTHVIFRFGDGTELRYKDVRQFGTMHLFLPGEEWEHPPLNQLGLEPLDDSFTFDAFRGKLAGKTTRLKPLLLDQSLIVGLGNIYVDEALFRARLHPETTFDRLTLKEQRRLYEAIIATLSEAVAAGGTSVKSYVNGQGEMGSFQHKLQVYGRKNEPCFACGRPIEKTVVTGRGTHFCPRCQRLKKAKKAQEKRREAIKKASKEA